MDMGIGKKVKNTGESLEGKAKETAGRAVGNEDLEAEGKVEQVESDAKQTVEKGKDTLRRGKK
jgi:uncharacterized protein YjbJ (UPF0337 family)